MTHELTLDNMAPIKKFDLVFEFQMVQSTFCTNNRPEVELTVSNRGNTKHMLSFFDEAQLGVTQDSTPMMILISEYFNSSRLSIEDGIYITEPISVAAKPRHIVLAPGRTTISSHYVVIMGEDELPELGKHTFELQYSIDGQKLRIDVSVVIRRQE